MVQPVHGDGLKVLFMVIAVISVTGFTWMTTAVGFS